MNRVKDAIGKTVHKVGQRLFSSELSQKENVVLGEKTVTPGMPEILRELAAEGIVLLENNGVLPLHPEQKVSVFGRCQYDWFYVGYGSGGDVHPPYTVNLMEGLAKAGVSVNEDLANIYRSWCDANPADHGWWGHWPYSHPEMPLEEAVVKTAAENSQVALVVIGRAAGEDRENVLEAGSYYLTEQEHAMLRRVTAAFRNVVVLLNSGNIMDLSVVRDYPISALVCVWQLGMESGNAVADVLTGRVNPSGKLSASVARNYRDYPGSDCFGNPEYNCYEEDIYVGYRYFSTFAPEKVLYPFGFGLSYTGFALEPVSMEREGAVIRLQIRVTNTGAAAGREVVQIYCQPPLGKLSKADRNLVCYRKTRLLMPGEDEVLVLEVRDADCASFDDSGVTGYRDAFVLEAGEYTFWAGNSSVNVRPAGSFRLENTELIRQCNGCCGPVESFRVLTREGFRPVTLGRQDLKQRILRELPPEIPRTGDQGIMLEDVHRGNATLEAFIGQLSDEELGDLTRGEGPMNSALGTLGNAGAFGGITESLRNRGILPMITADGPSGLRVKYHTSLLPCGTAIACSWNDFLVQELYGTLGREVRSHRIHVLLAPGMNIHRNPLCGRNFEYYSEDPYLTGKMAAAAVRGIQSAGVSACPKHFACNNQEVKRNRNDSRLSMRALREIYLKGFEICVREAQPQNIMTSYNKVNGVWSHYHYDLVTTILRKEWGYQGNVMTDWWMKKAVSPEFPALRNSAYRVRAQVDVLMPGGDAYTQQKYVFDREQLESLDQPEGLTRGELQRSARNVLQFILTKMEE